MQSWFQFEFPVIWQNFISVFIGLSVLLIGTIAYRITHRFKLGHELHDKDNPAVALSFSGFLLGLGWVLYHLNSESILDYYLWGTLSIVALLLGRFLNDRFLLGHFSNDKELSEDANVGTSAVELGSYLATSLVIQAALIDDSSSVSRGFLFSLGSFLVYFVLSQLIFAASAWIYKKLISYSINHEIEQDNVAAGISFGGFLYALGYLLGAFLENSDSLLGASLWALFVVIYLLGVSRIFDWVILRSKKMSDEIVQDRNWGLALVEASGLILMAWILESMVL